MTKKELHELYWIKRNIKQLETKLLELETEATRITTQLSQEPKGTRKTEDLLGEIVSCIVDTQEEINRQLKESYEIANKIERAIEALPPREAYLMRLRYIEHMDWENICVEMNYSWRQMHYIHADALKMLSA